MGEQVTIANLFRETAGVVSRLPICLEGIETPTELNFWSLCYNGVTADCKSAALRGMVGSIPTDSTNILSGSSVGRAEDC